jgi:hypothetical protein
VLTPSVIARGIVNMTAPSPKRSRIAALLLRRCGRREGWRLGGSDRSLKVYRELCVLDRPVMVNLVPAAIEKLKDPRRANVQGFGNASIEVGAALPPDRPKNVAGAMDGVVPKFNVNVRRALEYSFVHFVWLVGAAPEFHPTGCRSRHRL